MFDTPVLELEFNGRAEKKTNQVILRRSLYEKDKDRMYNRTGNKQ